MDLVYGAGRRDLSLGRRVGEDVAPVAQRLLSDLETYGEPFFARFTSLSDLISSLNSRRRRRCRSHTSRPHAPSVEMQHRR